MAFYGDDLIVADGSGDFQTLAAFESYYDGVDISATDGVRARIKGTTGDTGNINFGGWAAGQSATCKIVITADTGCGLQDRTAWKGADGSGNDAIVNQLIQYFETTNPICLDVYNIELTGTAKGVRVDYAPSGSICRVWNCHLRDGARVIASTNCGNPTTIYTANLLIKDSAGFHLWSSDADVTWYAWNITIDSGGTDNGVARTAGSLECRNIVIFDTSNNSFDSSVSDENYCAADDTTPDGANSIDSIVLDNNFTDYANEDYTVKDTSAGIYHAGSDQPAWFDTLTGGKDIRGVNWHATTPSIGAFEYVASGGATLPLKHPFCRPFCGPFGRF